MAGYSPIFLRGSSMKTARRAVYSHLRLQACETPAAGKFSVALGVRPKVSGGHSGR